MSDLFEKLEGVGFLPDPDKSMYYKRCDTFEIIVSRKELTYHFLYRLFCNDRRYNHDCQIAIRLIEYDAYFDSVKKILNCLDGGTMGSVLINALVEHQMTDLEKLCWTSRFPGSVLQKSIKQELLKNALFKQL